MRTEGQRDRHDEAKSRFSQFCGRAKNLNERPPGRCKFGREDNTRIDVNNFNVPNKTEACAFLSVFFISGIVGTDTSFND